MRFGIALLMIAGVVVVSILASTPSGSAIAPPLPSAYVATCGVRALRAEPAGGPRVRPQVRRGLELRNVGDAACALRGYLRVAWVSAAHHGREIGRAAGRMPGRVVRVTLRPGGQASAPLALRSVAHGRLPAGCRPVRAAGLRITLPGARRSLFVSAPTSVCSARIPGGLLRVGPLTAGAVR